MASNSHHSKKHAHAHAAKKSSPKSAHRWVKDVKTVSTDPPEGLFTRSPREIARSLASKKVSPKGPRSGMRMLTFFINRAGKGLSASRRAKLEKAKEILSQKIKEQKKAA
jgi:tRNA(adenine34) deaminase